MKFRRFLLIGLVCLLPGGAYAENDLLPSVDVGAGNLTIKLTSVVSPVSTPTTMASDGTGRLFIGQYDGEIRLLDLTGATSSLYLDTAGPNTFNSGDVGMTALAFHPDFDSVGMPGYRKFYTMEPEVSGAGTPDFIPEFNTANNHRSVVYEHTVDTIAQPTFTGTKREILRFQQPGTSHNVDDVAFGPDGLLYVSVGDGVNLSIAPMNSPLLTNAFGKILRIDPLGLVGTTSANGEYSIPGDNPFVGQGGGVVEEIWANGLRNPYRISFDPSNGDLYSSDTGQNDIEEINQIEKGKDYGWNLKEGSYLYNRPSTTPTADPDLDMNGNGDFADANALLDPVLEYDHQDGATIVGGHLYRGGAIPALDGLFVVADFQGNRDSDPQIPTVPNEARIFYGDPATGDLFEFNTDPSGQDVPFRILALGRDGSGELYVLGGSGEVYRIDPPPVTPPTPGGLELHTTLDSGDVSGGPLAIDSAPGLQQNGALLGAPGNPTGFLGESLDFSGSDSDRVDYGDEFDPGAGSMTVSLWFKPDAVAGGAEFLIGKGNAGSSNVGWSIFYENGTLIVRGRQVESATNGTKFSQNIAGALTDGVWHHVVMVMDTSSNTVRGYIDGSNTGWSAGGGGGQTDSLISGGTIANADAMLVGRRVSTGAAASAEIDDLGIWLRALTAGEVTTLYDNGVLGLDASEENFPVADFVQHGTYDTADILLGSGTVSDTAGSPNNGTIVGALGNPGGQIAQALDFNGSDANYIDFGNVFDPGTGSQSVSLWFNADDVATTQFLVGKGNASSGTSGWSVFIESGSLVVRGYQAGAPLSQRFSRSIGGTIQSATWHHVLFVMDADTDVVRAYLDGSDVGWVDGGGGGVVGTLVDGLSIESTEPLLLGRRATTGAPFAGSLDDLAIFDRALTPAEAAELHQNGLIGLDASNLTTSVVPLLGPIGVVVLAISLLGTVRPARRRSKY